MKPILSQRSARFLPLIIACLSVHLAGPLPCALAQELVIPRLPPLKNSVNPNPVPTVEGKTLALFEAGKFQELDELAARLRNNKEKDVHGNWKLSDFYEALRLPYTGKVRADADWNERTKKIERWIDERPESITAYVALANHYINYAWKGRGVYYGDRVTGEGWELFAKRMLDAATVLEDAERLKEKCPEWHRAQLEVALTQSWPDDKYNAAFEKGFAFAPDYWLIVTAKARKLMPRWGGKEGDWQAYALEIADRTKAKSGDIYYTMIFRSMLGYYNTYGETGMDWPRFKRGLYEIIRANPESAYWPRFFVSSCVSAKDPKAAWDILKNMKGPPDLRYWGTVEYYESCRAWAMGLSLPANQKK